MAARMVDVLGKNINNGARTHQTQTGVTLAF